MTVPNPTPDADDAMSEAVEVIQADRDAVQAFHRTMAAKLMADITSGKPSTFGDDAGHDGDAIHQAFARHRLAFAASERDAAREAGEGGHIEWPGLSCVDNDEDVTRIADVPDNEVPSPLQAVRWLARFSNPDEVASTTPRKIANELASICALLTSSPEAPATKPNQSAGERVERMREAAQFLCDRLDDLEWLDDSLQDTARDYMGHVEPALCRLKSALDALTDPMGGVTETGEIPEGMVPWAGGDSAPDDWPRFGRVAYRNGETSQGGTDYDWQHFNMPFDIIAYTPKPSSPVSRMEEGS